MAWGRSEQGRVISRGKREGEKPHMASGSRMSPGMAWRQVGEPRRGDRQADVGGRVCVVCAQCQSSVSRVVWERSEKKPTKILLFTPCFTPTVKRSRKIYSRAPWALAMFRFSKPQRLCFTAASAAAGDAAAPNLGSSARSTLTPYSRWKPRNVARTTGTTKSAKTTNEAIR